MSVSADGQASWLLSLTHHRLGIPVPQHLTCRVRYSGLWQLDLLPRFVYKMRCIEHNVEPFPDALSESRTQPRALLYLLQHPSMIGDLIPPPGHATMIQEPRSSRPTRPRWNSTTSSQRTFSYTDDLPELRRASEPTSSTTSSTSKSPAVWRRVKDVFRLVIKDRQELTGRDKTKEEKQWGRYVWDGEGWNRPYGAEEAERAHRLLQEKPRAEKHWGRYTWDGAGWNRPYGAEEAERAQRLLEAKQRKADRRGSLVNWASFR